MTLNIALEHWKLFQQWKIICGKFRSNPSTKWRDIASTNNTWQRLEATVAYATLICTFYYTWNSC